MSEPTIQHTETLREQIEHIRLVFGTKIPHLSEAGTLLFETKEPLSLRKTAQLLGLPRSTVFDLLRRVPARGGIVTPTGRTIERAEKAIASLAPVQTTRQRTILWDVPGGTTGQLRQVVPPQGASSYKLLIKDVYYSGGYKTSEQFDLFTAPVGDLVDMGLYDEGQIAGVIFPRG